MYWSIAPGGEFGGMSSYAVSEYMTRPTDWFALTMPRRVVATRA